ncbi:MAG: 50S ribosomal protein L3 [Planctomycetaceae bacterium]|nr:50S ribosomal protein L3 [Planctomycetaceae bacterium]
MALGLLGRKVGMTQIFLEDGSVVPVTVLEAGPCPVLQLRTTDRDGYEAVQLGFADRDRERTSRSGRGQVAQLDSRRSKRRKDAGIEPLARANCEPQRFVREIRGPAGELKVGDSVTVKGFEGVVAVDITGTIKGRGTAGLMKKWNFKGQRATHGVKKVHRHSGGTSANTFPARVFKGKKMGGRWGAERGTIRNLKVVRIDEEKNLLLVRGAVPGPIGGFVMVRPTNLVRGAVQVKKKK